MAFFEPAISTGAVLYLLKSHYFITPTVKNLPVLPDQKPLAPGLLK